jgi:hypothetical protein
MTNATSKASSFTRAASTCCFTSASCSMSSLIIFSITGPSMHFYIVTTTWSNCEPCPSIYSNTLQDSSCKGCSFYATSITLPWMEAICCCTTHCSWDFFILSTMVISFICASMKKAYCCASCNFASNFLSSGYSMR